MANYAMIPGILNMSDCGMELRIALVWLCNTTNYCYKFDFLINMSSQSPLNMAAMDGHGPQAIAEVSESAFEYLIGEILAMNYLQDGDESNNASVEGTSEIDFFRSQRLDELGYQVGYRFVSNVCNGAEVELIILKGVYGVDGLD
jgi:hypothetical protein